MPQVTYFSRIAMGLSLIAMLSAPGLAGATAAAVAYGDGHTSWATGKTQEEANRKALAECKEQNAKNSQPKGRCKLDKTKVIVFAKGSKNEGLVKRPDNLAAAKKHALKLCGAEDCTTEAFTKPGFYVVSKSLSDNAGNASHYIAYGFGNFDSAKKDSLSRCERNTRRTCEVLWTGAIAGAMETAPVQAAAPRQIAKAKSCRPNTPEAPCTSDCRNGDCVLTYENGCKMRVKLRPEFDPFTNKWVYPIPRC